MVCLLSMQPCRAWTHTLCACIALILRSYQTVFARHAFSLQESGYANGSARTCRLGLGCESNEQHFFGALVAGSLLSLSQLSKLGLFRGIFIVMARGCRMRRFARRFMRHRVITKSGKAGALVSLLPGNTSVHSAAWTQGLLKLHVGQARLTVAPTGYETCACKRPTQISRLHADGVADKNLL